MPTMTAPLPTIRPITDLRTHLNEVCTEAASTNQPIVLTKNGVDAFVLMSSEAFNSIENDQRMQMALLQSELELQQGAETISLEESNKKMREIFELWGGSYDDSAFTE